MWSGTANSKAYSAALDETTLQFDAEVTKTVTGSPTKDNGTSTFTPTVGGMTIDEHAGKHCVFQTSENDYIVVSNTATAVTVTGDASGEAADQDVLISELIADEFALGYLCIFTGGTPDGAYLVISNTTAQLVVHRNAEGESANAVNVRDFDLVQSQVWLKNQGLAP